MFRWWPKYEMQDLRIAWQFFEFFGINKYRFGIIKVDDTSELGETPSEIEYTEKDGTK